MGKSHHHRRVSDRDADDEVKNHHHRSTARPTNSHRGDKHTNHDHKSIKDQTETAACREGNKDGHREHRANNKERSSSRKRCENESDVDDVDARKGRNDVNRARSPIRSRSKSRRREREQEQDGDSENENDDGFQKATPRSKTPARGRELTSPPRTGPRSPPSPPIQRPSSNNNSNAKKSGDHMQVRKPKKSGTETRDVYSDDEFYGNEEHVVQRPWGRKQVENDYERIMRVLKNTSRFIPAIGEDEPIKNDEEINQKITNKNTGMTKTKLARNDDEYEHHHNRRKTEPIELPSRARQNSQQQRGDDNAKKTTPAQSSVGSSLLSPSHNHNSNNAHKPAEMPSDSEQDDDEDEFYYDH